MDSLLKRTTMLFAILIVLFGQIRTVPSQASVDACEYWVDPTGSNGNPGTLALPWATLEYAYYNAADNNCTVWFNPGIYDAASSLVNTGGRFTTTTTFKSVQLYKAILQNPGKVLDFQGVQNMVIEGFEITQTTPAPVPAQVMIDFHRATSPLVWAMHITFRNNIIHDANEKDISLIKGGVQYINFENNVFYNQGGTGQMLDINSAKDVTVKDNIFFNDFAVPDSFTRSYIEIKDTNGIVDGYEGSERITIKRNVFLNWQGAQSYKFVQVGVGDETYHSAKDITVENNLMIGNSTKNIGEAFGVHGAKDVSFVNNTIVGDLPASAYAMDITKPVAWIPLTNNENIYFYNNIWSDPTGTMGACFGCGGDDFSDGDPTSTTNLVLDNNLYYNGGDPIPPGNVLTPLVDDANGVVVNPGLNTNQSGIVLPRWNGTSFLNGNATIRQEFLRLVDSYGSISDSSPASGVANPAYASTDDILGNSRPGSPSMGAYEPLGFSASIDLVKSADISKSKVGDDIHYTVQIENTSEAGTPSLQIDSITDSLQGDLTNPSNYDTNNCGSSLSLGSSCTITYTYTVQPADPDPLMNSALVETHPQGYSFTVSDNGSKVIELFQPGITLEKSADVAKADPGDEILYTVLITNTSSGDSPNLVIDSITDSLQGDLTKSANYETNDCGSNLAPSASCTITYIYTVQSGDGNPLNNTATVNTHPSGFSNEVNGSDSVSVIIGDLLGIYLPLIFKN